jgi:hypothetical protein
MNVFFVIVALIAIYFRLSLSFSNKLILGMDGGYYPVQVRSILNTGHLAFSDVPIYFYCCAVIIKITSLFGCTITDNSIITVIKIIDSIALPLLVIPLSKMIKSKGRAIPFYAALAILLFAVFSFSPFIMLGDIQKNAFAIPILFLYIYFTESFLNTNKRSDLLLMLGTLLLIALTHFGVFVFALTFFVLTLFVVYQKKAILPSLITIVAGLAIIAVFDINRAIRLLTFWNLIFDGSIELHNPFILPLLLNILFSITLAVFGVIQYRNLDAKVDLVTKKMTIIFALAVFIFAFPFYEIQYVQRFNVLLFVPQSLLMLNLIRLNTKNAIPISCILLIITTLFSFMYFKQEKKPCISDNEYSDLQNIKKSISPNNDSTIIITRHGLEFWTSLALNVKVGNSRSFNKLNLKDYKNVLFLKQKNDFKKGPHDRKPPGEPSFPTSATLMQSTLYFNIYRINNLYVKK